MLELGATTYLQLINFIILVFFLTKIIWKPLMETLDSRQKTIETKVQEAEAINEEARNLKTRYETQIAEANAEAQSIFRQTQASAEKTKTRLLSEAKDEASRILRQAEREARAAHEKAMNEVRSYMADLAVTTAGKVLQESLDQPTQEKLMAEFVRKVGDKYVN